MVKIKIHEDWKEISHQVRDSKVKASATTAIGGAMSRQAFLPVPTEGARASSQSMGSEN